MLKSNTSTYLKYLYLDVEDFTVDRTVEAQSDIIKNLNSIVLKVLDSNKISKEEFIAMPTGDGICLAINRMDPFDLLINVSTGILEEINNSNEAEKDDSRKFKVRIGLNQNTDNIIEDINNNLNVAGRGVNLSQRIMSIGDGGNVFVSESVFDILREREKYIQAFRKLSTSDKHGNQITAYQLISNNYRGLNVELPVKHRRYYFEQPLTEYQAHFIANSIFLGEYFLTHTNSNKNVSICAIHIICVDTLGQIKDTKHKKALQRVDLDEKGLPRAFLQKIASSDSWLINELAYKVKDSLVDACHSFEDSDSFSIVPSPSILGKIKLLEQFPEVWEFMLTKYSILAATMPPLSLGDLKNQTSQS